MSLNQGLSFLRWLVTKRDGNFAIFPLLQVLVLYDAAGRDEEQMTSELTALTDVVRIRKGSGAPLQELVVTKDVKEWGIWAALQFEVTVTFM